MFENFSIDSTLIKFNLATGSSVGGAGYAESGFVNGIGGPDDRSYSITSVNIAEGGQYILSFKYASGGIISPLKIDINGVNTGTIYKLSATVDWTSNNAITFTLPYPITLVSGNNTFKFHGDGVNWGPDIGICTLALLDNKLKINTINKIGDINKFNFIGKWNDGIDEIWTGDMSATFSIKFNGVAIELMGIKDFNHGVYEISIDNDDFHEVDGYSPTRTGVVKIFDSGLLNKGIHVLNFKLKGVNPHGGRPDGQISYAVVSLEGEVNKLTINTTDKSLDLNKFNFIGEWNDGIDEIWTGDMSATFSIKFNGVAIELMGIKDFNHGIYEISIDNGDFHEVDGYSPTRTGVVKIFDSGLLNKGTHILNFKLKGVNPHGGRPDGQISYALVNLEENEFNNNNMLVEVIYSENSIMNFNNNWKFNLNDGINFANNSYNDSFWRTLRLPHDWSIEFNFNKNSEGGSSAGFLDGGTAWYRKTFKFLSPIKNKKVFISFDGVYVESTLYVNENIIGENQNGFTPFSFDITKALYFDDRNNLVAVKVKNPLPSCRWYSGSGIYRNVKLIIKDYVYVEENGVFITTPNLENDLGSSGVCKVKIKTNIINSSSKSSYVKLETRIYSKENMLVSKHETSILANIGRNVEEQNLTVTNPKLWDIYDGNMYKVIINLYIDNNLIDVYKSNFGFRYFKFDSNTGFWLNGKNLKIKGGCIHHDLGALGAAVNYDAIKRQVKMIKSMGANAIRLTHNPFSPEFIEICENEGILLVEEAFDCWEISKRKYDYARFFNEYAKRDIQRMVNRGKNSPAIIMWSIGNEIYDTRTARGITIAKNLISWVKEIDKTRPITIGEDKYRGSKVEGDPAWNDNINAIMDALDLVGYNYSENVYDVHHKAKPNWKMYGSEVSSAVRSRDVYLDSTNTLINDKENLQVTSYDNYNPIVYWGRAAEDAWKRDRDRQFIAGSFFWTAFDYIGEPTPFDNTYPAKSSYFGAIDTAGFPKDAYYLYQSQWTTEPMLHILPHWNWKVGDMIKVWIYSNVDTVEVFINDKSLGEKKFLNKTTNYGMKYLEASDGNLHLEWLVSFQPGILRAVGKRNGVIVVEDKIATAGNATAIRLTPESESIKLGLNSLIYIMAEVIDSRGIVIPTANNLINFEVDGGVIVGVDNGNPSSVERFKDTKRKAFTGKALVIIQCNTVPGNIEVRATSTGLKEASTIVMKKINDTIEVTKEPITSNLNKRTIYNILTDGVLGNYAVKGSGTSIKYAAYIGGPADGYSTVIINVNSEGTYNLNMTYRHDDDVRPMKIDVNGINTGTIYLIPRANPGKFIIPVTLNKGENFIKFHGNGKDYAPDLGIFYLTPIIDTFITGFPSGTYYTKKGVLENGASLGRGLSSQYVTNLGGVKNGAVTIDVNVYASRVYKIIIDYINNSSNVRNLKLDIDGRELEPIYEIPPATPGRFLIMAFLNEGINKIKFYGDGIENSPDLKSVSISDDLGLLDKAILSNGASNSSLGKISLIGGKNNGTVTINFNATKAGRYKLSFLEQSMNSTSLININGEDISKNYFIENLNSIKKNTTIVNLELGKNIIKFSGDKVNYSPDLFYVDLRLLSDKLLINNFKIGYSIAKGILTGGAKLELDDTLAGWIGGPSDGASTVAIPVKISGSYNLVIEYIDGDGNRPLKIEVNGVDTGSIYKTPATNGWTLSDIKTITIPVNLESGNNTIKFHGDGRNYGPSLGELTIKNNNYNTTTTFTTSKTDTSIELNGSTVVENGLFKGIGGSKAGELIINVSVPYTGIYDFAIDYLAENNDSKIQIEVNGESTETVYNFQQTKSMNIVDEGRKIIQLKLLAGNNKIRIF
ncbi:glycoside hydrolase family 2 TIM barrel-domain containing protein [Clostridium tarantellae]|uniref:DUF4982 domain-containing protein n=1 Tax=Clostridium tarantellae TaxID=39493 RepID=A0A6I1MJU1_9CLOT|nr:glycoside hydrolase family 2 TIM barrel-domain containing protein [Clostridium tarantellae]MPQ42432.1 DUF4982 domain-containing protein [Clostridium tarantellae]